MSKISDWLREASCSDDADKLVKRCEVAAGEIERLENENKKLRLELIRVEMDKIKTEVGKSFWSKWIKT
jgi:hypothetical protein